MSFGGSLFGLLMIHLRTHLGYKESALYQCRLANWGD